VCADMLRRLVRLFLLLLIPVCFAPTVHAADSESPSPPPGQNPTTDSESPSPPPGQNPKSPAEIMEMLEAGSVLTGHEGTGGFDS